MVGKKLVEEGLELGVNGVDEFVFHEFIDKCLSRNGVSICLLYTSDAADE